MHMLSRKKRYDVVHVQRVLDDTVKILVELRSTQGLPPHQIEQIDLLIAEAQTCSRSLPRLIEEGHDFGTVFDWVMRALELWTILSG